MLCQRCTRFSDQIAGDKFIDLLERGSAQQIGINSAEPFQSYYSGNTIQICPVGALTSAAYRFRARPFDLVSTDTVCEHCASGCALRTDHRAGAVTRRLARIDPEVNEDWNCDKGRFAFPYVREGDRITRPMVRDADGALRPTSWTEAMEVAARGLLEARDNGGVGVLTGGRLTVTDAYAYAKFARLALRTNDIDFRARQHSAEEAAFLGGSGGRRHPGDHRGVLRRAGEGVGRAAGRAGAGGGIADPVPAAAQGIPARRSGVLARRADHPQPGEDGRHPDRRGAGRRARGAERRWPRDTVAGAGVADAAAPQQAGRAAAHPGRRGAGRRAGRADPRPADRRRRAGRRDRRRAGLGAAAGR